MRYFLNISYKGTHFHGWQIQPNASTIQEEIEKALSTIFNTKISIIGSGRTDAGVHALEQFAQFDTEIQFDKQELKFKLNSILNQDICINTISKVKQDAHTRFDATKRTYIYKIIQQKNPFLKDLVSYYPKEQFDIAFLNELAQQFIGKKDFESFAKVKSEVNNFICEISEAKWEYKDNLLEFTISANRFLRGMVRAIVGTMIDIINGKIPKEDLPKILASKDRKKAGQAAKPHGLYLAEIKYPEDIYLQD